MAEQQLTPTERAERIQRAGDLLSALQRLTDLERVRLVLAALDDAESRGEARGRAQGWQSIETAPKDGTRVLVDDDDLEYPVVAFWQALKQPNGGAFKAEYGRWWLPNPSGWQPLPAPPASDGSEQT